MTVVIWHNPRCSNSRKTLELIKDAGIEPQIVDYLKNPPDHSTLVSVINRMGIPVREVMRKKEAIYNALNLDTPEIEDALLIEAMLAHPILINRPIVITESSAKLCRPPETVLGILPTRKTHL